MSNPFKIEMSSKYGKLGFKTDCSLFKQGFIDFGYAAHDSALYMQKFGRSLRPIGLMRKRYRKSRGFAKHVRKIKAQSKRLKSVTL